MEPETPPPLRPTGPQFDECYKLLFSYPETVRDLIVGFIARDFSDRLDLPTLERVPPNTPTAELLRRQGDQVWRVRFRDSERHLVIVLEFQSTPDSRMTARMVQYVGLAHEMISRDPEKYGVSAGPPVILPVVLFCGERTWPRKHNPVRLPWMDGEVPIWEHKFAYSEVHQYFLIDFQSISLDELLTDNLVSCIIALERRNLSREQRGQVREWVGRLTARLRFFGNPALTEAYVTWTKEILIMGNIIDPSLKPLEQLEAIEAKFVYLSDPEWAREWIDAGLKKGREEGIEKGIEKGREEGIEKGIEKGRAEGIEKGIEKGRAEVLGAIRQNLYHQAGSKFDPKTAKQLAQRLDKISDPDLLLKISRQIQEDTTSASLFKCLKTRT